MISASTDRIDYGDLLTAPPSYELDFALGTTYSLDLKALLGAYVSLGLNVACDSSCQDSAMHLFAAIAGIHDKVLVMCEKGRMRAPATYNRMFSQVAKGIVQVDLPGGKNAYPSFHPKLWIIRFAGKHDHCNVRYRIVVLSRNLTFDQSWDVAGSFEGDLREHDETSNASNGGNAISRALESLLDCIPTSRESRAYREKLASMAEEVRFVPFKAAFDGWALEHPFNFTEMSYGHMGNKPVNFKEAFDSHLENAHRALIMTPFLSSGSDNPVERVIKDVEEGRIMQSDAVLVTRRASLAECDCNRLLDNLSVYALKDYLVSAPLDGSGEDAGEPDGSRSPLHDIHAKIFAFEEGTGNGRRTHLFFGSANATRRGVRRQLRGHGSHQLEVAQCLRLAA